MDAQWASESERKAHKTVEERANVCVRVFVRCVWWTLCRKGFLSIAVMRFYLKQADKRKGKDPPESALD